eukprot:TRINITY_DN5142_c0_g2_i1.p1 TRINITY_DN5142_c0_g2~~TRINITY_DN5142_c0_g2_i1.p1  ORF type:complete len:360 (+),score=45.62 TRINITY_DN5142_c0_g2_i1:84-1163(+)
MRSTIQALLIIFSVIFISAQAATRIEGRRLLVNEPGTSNFSPYFVHGVCYYPIPIGFSPSVKYEQYRNTTSDRQVWMRDSANFRSMGINTIRGYGWDNGANHTAFFDEMLRSGVRVIVQLYIAASDNISDQTVRNNLVNSFVSMIQKQYHEAVLFWLVSNEVNLIFNGKENDFFTLLQAMRDAQDANVPLERRLPVTTTLADVNLINLIRTYDSYVDLWAVQLYRGRSFGNFFTQYRNASSKPVLITEYGIDAYDSRISAVNETMQQDYDSNLALEILRNNDTCSGGTVFAYVDEWWKCSGLPLDSHDTCAGGANSPDNQGHEEWYGIHSTALGGSGAADVLTPRSVVNALKSIWAVNP